MNQTILSLALALAASSAYAITPTPAPKPEPTPAPAAAAAAIEQHSTSTSSASNNSAYNTASSGSTSSSTSSSGGGSGIAYGSSGGNSSTTNHGRSVALGFPAINFGSASTSECLVGGPEGGALGWNFAARTAPAVVEAKVCNLRALAREAASQCQWRTAAVLRGEAFRALTGSELPPVPDAVQDVAPSACIQGMQPAPVSPPPTAPAQPVTVIVAMDIEQAAAAAPAASPTPRRPAPPRPVRSDCPSGTEAVQVCKPVQR